MNEDLPHDRPATDQPQPGGVTREMVHARTRELARLAGRDPAHVSHADYEQARRDLTGESDTERQDAVLEPVPQESGWSPAPGSSTQQAAETPNEDEDDEGRSDTVQLVNSGVVHAEREQAQEASRDAGKKDEERP